MVILFAYYYIIIEVKKDASLAVEEIRATVPDSTGELEYRKLDVGDLLGQCCC